VWEIKEERIFCTPSSSTGKLLVRMGGSAEYPLAKSQWKKRWASFLTLPQAVHSLSMLTEYLPALCPGASTLLMSLQVNDFDKWRVH
jgi:hypothetical protein